jgi:preprotein translocase subunit SecA
VLVGTISVEKSELLSSLLRKRGIPHEVLNAKQHDREATIVAQAGRKGAVTVATNMAGRGTDIMLGGNPSTSPPTSCAAAGCRRSRRPRSTSGPGRTPWSGQRLGEDRARRGRRGRWPLRPRHRAARVPPHRQPAARPLRPQGDPGLSRFYLSLGDDLMRLFNAGAVEMIMDRLNIPDDVPIESKMVSRAIRSAQTQVEQQNFEIRKNVLKYDEVLNRQRTVIYDERRKVLSGATCTTRSATWSTT